MCLACAGILMTIITACIFGAHWNTPVIKASGRELSLILLAGIFLSFLITFVIVAKPSMVICGVMRFAIGLCYTICYAAVVTKTNRVARIFTAANHPRFVSPLSSTIIALVLISVEVIINVIWLLVEPPKTTYFNDPANKATRVLVCSGLDETIMAGLIYPFFLILAATLYAFKTRKCPGGFNETKFIFFANTVTTIHWFVYVPLYLAFTNLSVRPVILAFSLSVSGIVQLSCLLFPKLYLVVFKPRKNTPATVMTTHHSRQYAIPDTPPNSVAVGLADGPAMLAKVYDRYPDAAMLNSLNAGQPQNRLTIGIQANSKGEIEDEFPDTPNVGKRHQTWSHELSLQERPRSRSLSISVSTQTNVNAKPNNPANGIRHIHFNAEVDCEDCTNETQELITAAAVGTENVSKLSDFKLSVTDDEFEDLDEIIAEVMQEEEEEEDEEEEEQEGDCIQTLSSKMYPEISFTYADDEVDTAATCSIGMSCQATLANDISSQSKEQIDGVIEDDENGPKM